MDTRDRHRHDRDRDSRGDRGDRDRGDRGDREREDRDRREKPSRPKASARLNNEYFVPKDGIDREVITADICRYLGNDALVRPGNYVDPQTRVEQTGYFITAYRNLTSRMIEDLKADSERWEAERRQTASRGQPLNVDYRNSTTHEARQYHGPTGEVSASAPAYGTAQGYGQTAAASAQQPHVYDSPYQSSAVYQGTAYVNQPTTGGYTAASPQAYGNADGGYYVAGANLGVADYSSAQATPRAVPATNQYTSASTYGAQQDPRYYATQSGPSPVPPTQQYGQPTDPYYGRAGGVYDNTAPAHDPRYQDPGYGPSPTAATDSRPPRRDRSDRDPERESKHHRRRG